MNDKKFDFKGRVTRPVMRTHAGIRQPMEYYKSAEIRRACDDFLKNRGLHVGLHSINYGKGES